MEVVLTKTLRHKILEAMRDNPASSLKNIASLIGVNVNLVKTIAYKLKSQGYIERTGRGYVLTERGLRLLKYMEKRTKETTQLTEKPIEEIKPEITPTLTSIEERRESSLRYEQIPEMSELIQTLREISDKIRELEKRLVNLEAQVHSIEKALVSTQRKTGSFSLETPVMTYNEAVSKYGPQIEKLLSENKVIRVGSLVVDLEFYNYFRSKFPIKTIDVDKLSIHERQLLEEMRKEALVVLHAGREYKLVS